MKKHLRILTLGLGLFACSNTFAQDVSINITNQQNVTLGDTISILVTICNEDPAPITAPANKVRPLLSVGANVTIVGATNTDGSTLTNFSIMSISSGTANSIMLLMSSPLANADCYSFLVKAVGMVVSPPSLIGATIGFQGPQTPGNNVLNDNSGSSIGVIAPLPVTLLNFNAQKDRTTAALSWATSVEANSDRFEIEHSLTGKDWIRIGTVASNRESTNLRNYSFSHTNPADGDNMYRLKMVDQDNAFSYSNVRVVNFGSINSHFSIYPNPVQDVLKIKNYSLVAKVTISDLSGKMVYATDKTQNGEISVQHLKPGMYMVRLIGTDGQTSSHKMVLGKK